MKLRILILFLVLNAGSMTSVQGVALPDLIVNSSRLQSSIYIKTQNIRPSSCSYAEGCVTGTGSRRLLKFDTAIANIGSADLPLGNPAEHPELFEWSLCHDHYHLKSATSYELLTPDLTRVVVGRKNAFCFRDGSKYLSGAGPRYGYTCGNQGITVGWQDVYSAKLDCQWIDITGVPAGTYILRVTVNPAGLLPESNLTNNSAQVTVTISKRYFVRYRFRPFRTHTRQIVPFMAASFFDVV